MTKAKTITTIKDLTPDTQNANKHSQRGMGMMEQSIQECGFGDSLTVDKHGNVISGNGRLETLAAIDMTDAIVVQSDGTRPVIHQRTDLDLKKDTKAKRLGILQNRVGQTNLEWDTDVLAQLAADGVELDDLFSADELTELLNDAQAAAAGAGGDEYDAEPDEAQTRVQYGDLWRCGKHRVLCGDSTKAEDVAKVMGGEKAVLMATDPPYGVDYDGIENDGRKGLAALLRAVMKEACAHSVPGASVYMFHSDKCADIANDVFREFCHFSSMIVWVKPSLVMGQSDYHSRHEPCIYGWFSNGAHKWYGDRKGDSVWELGRENVEGHTTPKPIDFFVRALKNSSKSGGIVYDPFLGSGTTMIAAERTGRKCYGIEISPKYVDVILSRYEAETGQTAELIEQV